MGIFSALFGAAFYGGAVAYDKYGKKKANALAEEIRWKTAAFEKIVDDRALDAEMTRKIEENSPEEKQETDAVFDEIFAMYPLDELYPREKWSYNEEATKEMLKRDKINRLRILMAKRGKLAHRDVPGLAQLKGHTMPGGHTLAYAIDVFVFKWCGDELRLHHNVPGYLDIPHYGLYGTGSARWVIW